MNTATATVGEVVTEQVGGNVGNVDIFGGVQNADQNADTIADTVAITADVQADVLMGASGDVSVSTVAPVIIKVGSPSSWGDVFGIVDSHVDDINHWYGQSIAVANFEIGVIVNDVLDMVGAINPNPVNPPVSIKATLAFLAAHPQMACSGEYLRKCWAYFRMAQLWGGQDGMLEALPGLTYTHYYELSRLMPSPDKTAYMDGIKARIAKAAAEAVAKGLTVRRMQNGITKYLAEKSGKSGKKPDKKAKPVPHKKLVVASRQATKMADAMVVRAGNNYDVSSAMCIAGRLGHACAAIFGKAVDAKTKLDAVSAALQVIDEIEKAIGKSGKTQG